MRVIDLTGQRFGRLVVIERAENNSQGHARWLCRCDCGKMKIANRADLKNGQTKSCGCLRAEITRARSVKHYGRKETPRLYTIWHHMIERCEKTYCKEFRWYGARGISVCEEWKNDFVAFRYWALSHGYSEKLTIDRIDNEMVKPRHHQTGRIQKVRLYHEQEQNQDQEHQGNGRYRDPSACGRLWQQ